ncbi:uncharacterized protein DEA37_0001796 [Paragonimus westermani]|uniref:Uncharacterized protein n=1 Tax=Paragonimus westermani TaxID=34504 RepID=A0A5J4NWF3_9TREM|nr:uncharacterized protein DEA37_0001796 [Paragonimus westermani]
MFIKLLELLVKLAWNMYFLQVTLIIAGLTYIRCLREPVYEDIIEAVVVPKLGGRGEPHCPTEMDIERYQEAHVFWQLNRKATPGTKNFPIGTSQIGLNRLAFRSQLGRLFHLLTIATVEETVSIFWTHLRNC